ncbi:organic cation transporter 1 [Caerostris darwini]|uniref:Organic cation transporter 1 n=1 Tax=Caerostris darwini TaxID=1538125 RepID=A0AAV4PRL7_9ARAC|nr:organic cation transporter 1 [Caerostris darwini]
MEFEDILLLVGGYGKFQRNLTFFFLVPVSCALPCFWMNFIFMVSVPDHWCYVPELANLSTSQQKMLIGHPSNPSCTMYNLNYSQVLVGGSSVAPNHTETYIPCVNGWTYDKQNYEVTAATKFNLVCDKSHFPSLLLTLQNAGSLIGTPIYGILSDKYGRKLMFLALAVVVSSTEIASVLVNNFIIFAILRAMNGISEIVAPDMRAHMNGVINCSWAFGLCVLPLVAYLARSWVILGIASAACGFGILMYWFFLPESPSWHISQGRYEDAAKVMMTIAKTNGKEVDYNYILLQLEILGEKIRQTKEQEKKDPKSSLLKYPRLRRNFIILCICWSAFYVGYSGLTYNITNLSWNEFLNFFLLSAVEVPANLTFWFLMDRYGRRWSAALGFVMISVFCLIPLIDFDSSDIIGSMLAKFLISGIFMITDQQGSELFPTAFRTFGIGTGKAIATAATLGIPYITLLNQYGKALPFVLIGLTSLVTGILASFLPETLNENLPQTMTDAEAFGKNQKYFSWTKKAEKSKDLAVVSTRL